MTNIWDMLKKGPEPGGDTGARWTLEQKRPSGPQEEPQGGLGEIDPRPIEPGGRQASRMSLIKWLLFLAVLIYMLFSYFRVPVLTGLGRFLVVEHPVKAAELVVCLGGAPVERALAVAEIHRQGLAPKVLLPRDKRPDGVELLEQRGGRYPESQEVLAGMLTQLGVPAGALVLAQKPVASTLEEAQMVRDYCREENVRSLIVLTSPYHSRRAWMVYRKVFEGEKREVIMRPTPYSGFRVTDWWEREEYLGKAAVEYLKLVYQALKSRS